MNQYRFLRIVDAGTSVSLVLNRPPLNVMNIEMLREINGALRSLERHPDAKVLLIRGEGKAFSAGVDVADHTADRIEEMMKEFHSVFRLLHGFRIPTIAVVHGAALGGGCEVAIYCDMVVASEGAKFGQPEIRLGVFPPVGAAMFPRLIGRNRSLELLLGGETISAAEADRMGLINRVFPVDGFDKAVDDFVAKFTRNSRVILEMTKRAVDLGLYRPCMEAIDRAENVYLNDVMKTHDAQEGLTSFMEKRAPVWRNA